MYRYALIFAVTLLTFAAISAVQAEETRVSYPFIAGSLHEGPMDMVYYIDPTEEAIVGTRAPYHVYATFAGHAEDAFRARHEVILKDGQIREIVLPEHPEAIYRFWRQAHRVHASVEIVTPQLIAAVD